MSSSRGTETPILIFVHIRKAAGSAMREIIAAQYLAVGEERKYATVLTCNVSNMDELKKSLADTGNEDMANAKAIVGQMPFGIHRLLSRPCIYVTMLRDPVERVASYYDYIRQRSDHHFHAQSLEMGLGEFVTESGYLDMDNGQTRILSGLPNPLEDPPLGGCDWDMLRAAENNIVNHFAVAGLTEMFAESAVLLARTLDWVVMLYGKANVNLERSELSEDDRRIVAACNVWDRHLYDYVAEWLREQVRDMDVEFHGDVLAFRKAAEYYPEAVTATSKMREERG